MNKLISKKSKSKKWETPVCNLCEESNYKVEYDNLTYWEYPGQFRIVSCASCGLVYTSPRPVLSEIGKYYKSKNYFGRNILSVVTNDDDSTRENSYGPMYKKILDYKKTGRILDIGAGTGLLLSKFKDLGWQAEGVEIESNAVKYAKQTYGINLIEGDFLGQKFTGKSYDVIVLNGALEHLHKPLEAMKKIHGLLKKDGMVIVSVPNIDSVGKQLFGKNWFPWQPPRHLYHFSPKTVTRLFNSSGFNNTEIIHSYDIQNYYILFQSMRYMMSPKFKKKSIGGLENKDIAFKPSFSIYKELGKISASIFAHALSCLEPIIKKGEVMIVYAKK